MTHFLLTTHHDKNKLPEAEKEALKADELFNHVALMPNTYTFSIDDESLNANDIIQVEVDNAGNHSNDSIEAVFDIKVKLR